MTVSKVETPLLRFVLDF